MNAVELYDEHRRDRDRQLAGTVDSWVPILAAVGDLAAKIAQTDFVPDAMRGKPAAVAAAILAGREMGVGPMTALQGISVIKGRPAQSAQLMRQLSLAAGHSIRYVEVTDTRVIVEGRRRGEEDWTAVSFNADQARKAGINLSNYPQDKLVARATSRLCRRLFADAIGGMPYSIEELEDGELGEADTAGIVALPTRTARRRGTAPTPTPAPSPEPSLPDPIKPAAKGVTRATRAQAAAAPVATVPAPPLPDEEPHDGSEADDARDYWDATHDKPEPEPEEPPTGAAAARAALHGAQVVEDVEAADPDGPITTGQMKKMHATFNDYGITDRTERLEITRGVLSNNIISATELSHRDARVLLDVMSTVSDAPDPAGALRALAALGGDQYSD